MAGNSKDGFAEQLEEHLQRGLQAGSAQAGPLPGVSERHRQPPVPMPENRPEDPGGTVLALMEMQAEQADRLAQYYEQYGAHNASRCREYAELTRQNAQRFADELLQTQLGQHDRISRIIGKF